VDDGFDRREGRPGRAAEPPIALILAVQDIKDIETGDESFQQPASGYAGARLHSTALPFSLLMAFKPNPLR
jgi:hypothetical protein